MMNREIITVSSQKRRITTLCVQNIVLMNNNLVEYRLTTCP